MNWGGPEFVLAIIALSTGGWLVNNWIRARHGYALEDEWGGKTRRADDEATGQLTAENRELRDQLEVFSERVNILERIVTDKGYAVASEIDSLRAPRQLEGQTRQ
ncbi:MAG: hypothetical protein KGL44_01740 [Sphingomonadales bacterium]|nr:hypothetical protein [Sphingomonadales bacterium]